MTAGLGISSCTAHDNGDIGAASTAGANTGASSGNATDGSSSAAANGAASTGASSGWVCEGSCPADSLGEVDWSKFDGGADTCVVSVGLFPSNCGAISCIVPCAPDAATDAAPTVDAGVDADEEPPVVADANGVE